ncbi:hypothetical protein J2X68_007750 [Streptomyces sp. 3330]|uniref:hypothetical protein n=1 Tax=Streptomyces sp. 3330 TaxID=2817755 RepID=UPI0028659F01|nr:hypothetical protein [Streptomyces sp. 3330]MDR6981008.1 hypothetical protein [Streptomyces sp. 3330]
MSDPVADGLPELVRLREVAGDWLRESTADALQYALMARDWSPVAGDACRIAATVRGPSIIVVPRVLADRTVGELVCTNHWGPGQTAVAEALNHLPHAVTRLFGYQTEQHGPLVVARKLLTPDRCHVVDALGQIRLSLPPGSAMWGRSRVTIVVNPTGHVAQPAARCDTPEQVVAAVTWSTLACALAGEGPFRPQRIAGRLALGDQRDLAGAFLGILSSFVYLRRVSGLNDLLVKAATSHAGVPGTPLSEVMDCWARAAGDGANEDSLLRSAHELLATGIKILARDDPDLLGNFTRWLRGNSLDSG